MDYLDEMEQVIKKAKCDYASRILLELESRLTHFDKIEDVYDKIQALRVETEIGVFINLGDLTKEDKGV